LSPPPRSRDRRWLAYAALLVAISGIAWSAIFIRWSAVPGPSSAFYRVFIAALVLVPWRLLSLLASPRERGRVAGVTRRAFLLALGGGVFFGFDLALYNTSVMRTTATTATLFGNNAPIFVGIGTWIFFRRRPTRSFWIGLALAMSGAAIVMIANATRPEGSSGDLTGALMSLGAAAFFAAYLLATEHVREEMDTLTFSTIAIAGSVLTLLAVCAIVGAPLSGFGATTWLALMGLGLISQLGAYLGLAYALGHLPATITSVGLLAQVPLTAILAVPLLGEPLTGPYLAGGALVLAGIYVVNRAPVSRQSAVALRQDSGRP
jgi:drug/metabolite transporter (DMT)-like permease